MKRRRKLLTPVMAALQLCVCLGLGYSPSALAQNLVWAQRAGGTSADFGNRIAVDSAGNSYVVGSVDTVYAFFAKYDSNGNQLWFRQTPNNPGWSDVAVDAAGANIFVTGSFFGSASFGPGVSLSSTSVGAFVAKYDSAGNAVWARKADGTQETRGSSIAIDNARSSYITGQFGGTVTFGSQATLTATGYDDTFIAKYNDLGNLVWAKRAGGGSSSLDESYGVGIAVDSAGNSCYVTGVFSANTGMMTFPPLSTASTGITPGSWVAKCDSGGDFVWAKQTAVLSYGGAAVSVDSLGNSYLSGPSLGFSIGPQGYENPLVAKYDDNGNRIWGRGVAYPGSFYTQSNGVAVDVAGNSYVTGIFSGTENFGPIVPAIGPPTPPVFLTAAGLYDMFTAKYDSDGNLLWVRQGGVTVGGYAYGKDIALDGGANSHVTGFFTGTANFAAGVSLTSLGQEDIFLAQYEPSLTASVITWPSPQPVVYGTALGVNQLNPTASVPGSFTFSPPAGTVLDAGNHFLSASFTPADPSQYTSVSSQVTLLVDLAPLTVTADDRTRAFGSTTNLTGTIAGLVNNDNITATFTTTATPASPPGNYPITPLLSDPGNRRPNYMEQLVNGTLTITPGATHFSVSAPSPVTAGTPFLFTVTALDPSGNIVPSYTGTVHFTSSDLNAVLPTGATLINGVSAPLSGTLRTVGINHTITATDTILTSITGLSNSIVVNPGTVAQFQFSGTPNTPIPAASTINNVTVTALDGFGNVATGYTGNILLGGTDRLMSFSNVTPLTNGSKTFSVTFFGAGRQNVQANDSANPAIQGSSNFVIVNPGSAIQFVVFAPQSVTGGTPLSFSVAARDPWGNNATSYAGTVNFTSTDPSAILPPGSTLTNGLGSSLTAILNTAGPQSITAADGSLIPGSAPITVNGSAAPTPTGSNVTVQPIDPATGAPQGISLTFSNVTTPGGANAVQVPITPPANFSLKGVGYDITTTALFTPPLTVCFNGSYTSSDAIWHYENGTWVQPTQQLLPPGPGPYTTICAVTNSLSPFGVFTPLPTASTITWLNPQPIVYGTALGGTQLNATASVPGSFVFSPPAGTVLDAGDRTLSATFTPADTVHYTSASSQVTLHVDTAPLTVTADNKTRTYGSTTIFTGTIAGLVNNDNITASYTTTATQTSSPGN